MNKEFDETQLVESQNLKSPHSYSFNDQVFGGQVLCILADFAFGKWLEYSNQSINVYWTLITIVKSVQFSSIAQSCPTLCDPMNQSMPGLPGHHQLPGFT